MDEENKKNIAFLENFFKINKNTPIIIKQPKQIGNYDFFGKKEEEKIERPKRNSSQKLCSINKINSVIRKQYNIIKESTIFKEEDSKKSFKAISNLKNHYKNYLYNTIIKNKSLNSTKFNSARVDNYNRQKTMINLNEIYQKKLANVSITNFLIF